MTDAETQMAAMVRGHPHALDRPPPQKTGRRVCCGLYWRPGPSIKFMAAHPAQQRSTLLLILSTLDETPFLDRIMIVDASTETNQINIG